MNKLKILEKTLNLIDKAKTPKDTQKIESEYAKFTILVAKEEEQMRAQRAKE